MTRYVTLCGKLSDPHVQVCRDALQQENYQVSFHAIPENAPYDADKYPELRYRVHCLDAEPKILRGIKDIYLFLTQPKPNTRVLVVPDKTKSR